MHMRSRVAWCVHVSTGVMEDGGLTSRVTAVNCLAWALATELRPSERAVCVKY